MADLTVTAASCVPVAGTRIEWGTAGATITAGKAIYLAAATNKWGLADANSATEEVRQCTAVALCGASDGQPLAYVRSGSITLGATMTAGVAYYLSDTAGGICPVADIGAGEYVCLIGVSTSTTVLKVGPVYSGVSL